MSNDWFRKANGGERFMNSLVGVTAIGLLGASFWFFFLGEWLRALSCLVGWFVASGVLAASINSIKER